MLCSQLLLFPCHSYDCRLLSAKPLGTRVWKQELQQHASQHAELSVAYVGGNVSSAEENQQRHTQVEIPTPGQSSSISKPPCSVMQ